MFKYESFENEESQNENTGKDDPINNQETYPNQDTKQQTKYSSQQSTSVLCPDYKIQKSKNGEISCLMSFPSTFCNKTVDVYLEVWTIHGVLLQSSAKKMKVDCNLVNNDRKE